MSATKKPYYEVNGRRLPSVTTILGVLAKPALVQWASNEAARAAIEFCKTAADPKSVTEEDFNKWRKTHEEKKEKAGDIGTALHNVMDALMTKIDSGRMAAELYKSAGEKVYANLYGAAERAIAELGLTLDTPGSMVFSELHGYAGTFDAVVKRGDKRYLVDYKTSGAVYPEMHLQTAAYIMAGWSPGTLFPESGHPRRAILRLDKKDGSYEWVESPQTLEEDFAVFLAAKRLYDWQTRDAKWRKGE